MRAAALILIAGAVLACGTRPGISWGPLAVMHTDGGMQARNVGIVVITDRCVFLEGDGERALLLWPANQTGWSPESAEISFRRYDGDVVMIHDGQSVELGGGSFSATIDGLNGEKVSRSVEWVAEPDPECLSDGPWLVSDVQPA
jgi:hypothetical protein